MEVDFKLPSLDILKQDTPDLQSSLKEFQEALNTCGQKLTPLIEKSQAGEIPSMAGGSSYLEMKYNLMISYCQFLSFYLLLKIEGAANIDKHPVVKRLLYVKTMFEKLKPLDVKL